MSQEKTKPVKSVVARKPARKTEPEKDPLEKAKVKSSGAAGLHPQTHRLLAKTLSAVSVSATTQRYQATLSRLILLLESYGRTNPVQSSTPVGAACWDLDTLATDINERWNFPPGKGYQPSQLDGSDPAGTVARDIDNRGGILNGK